MPLLYIGSGKHETTKRIGGGATAAKGQLSEYSSGVWTLARAFDRPPDRGRPLLFLD
jgi:hypothetical protein